MDKDQDVDDGADEVSVQDGVRAWGDVDDMVVDMEVER